jgi:two-component system, NtrC family, sensor kinase
MQPRGARYRQRLRRLQRRLRDRGHEVGLLRSAALREHAFLERVVETMPSGLWVFDAAGALERINEAAAELSQLSGVVSPPGFAEVFPDLEREGVLSRDEELRAETSLRRPDGSRVPVWVVCAKLRGDEGRKLIVNVIDLSERKHLEQSLVRASRMEAVGQLAAGVAHEVNTPVQFIGDGVRFLRDCIEDLRSVHDESAAVLEGLRVRGTLSPSEDEMLRAAQARGDVDFVFAEAPAAVERTLRGVDRVAEIVRALRAFAHHDDGSMSPVDLNAAIRDAVVVARGEYKHTAELSLELTLDLPLVPCNVGQIHQVLLNLLVNAAHAIEARRHGGLGRIVVRSWLDEESACVSVSDDGMGIEPSIRARVFDPFFTTKPIGKGTGQGLALALSFVESNHGGQLTFDSAVGEGTTFLVRLPLRRGQRLEVAA